MNEKESTQEIEKKNIKEVQKTIFSANKEKFRELQKKILDDSKYQVEGRTYTSTEVYHFIGRTAPSEEARLESLLQILKTRQLEIGKGIPTLLGLATNLDDLFFGEIAPIKAICFCDIPFYALGMHMQKYGPFGIAFLKQFLIGHGLRPVFYVPKNTKLFGQGTAELIVWLKELYEGLFSLNYNINGFYKVSPGGIKVGINDKWQNFLADLAKKVYKFDDFILQYIKIFDDSLPDDHPDNYYMEREWRITDNIKFELTDVTRIIFPQKFKDTLLQEVPFFKQYNEIPLERNLDLICLMNPDKIVV